jgi:hypothetical protein
VNKRLGSQEKKEAGLIAAMEWQFIIAVRSKGISRNLKRDRRLPSFWI